MTWDFSYSNGIKATAKLLNLLDSKETSCKTTEVQRACHLLPHSLVKVLPATQTILPTMPVPLSSLFTFI